MDFIIRATFLWLTGVNAVSSLRLAAMRLSIVKDHVHHQKMVVILTPITPSEYMFILRFLRVWTHVYNEERFSFNTWHIGVSRVLGSVVIDTLEADHQ